LGHRHEARRILAPHEERSIALTKGAKVALGCLGAGCLVTAGVAAVLVFGIGAGAHWLKGKTESFVNQEQRIEDLHKKANAMPFHRPPDGVIAEDRLLKFLEVRKRVYSVYERHRSEFEGMKQKKEADFTDLKNALGLLGDVRLALAQAQADLGMGEEEYQFMVQAVYHSAMASTFEKDAGKPPSEAMGELMKQAQEAMKKGVDAARKEGVPGVKDLPDDTVTGATDQMEKAAEAMKGIDAPKANVELFRKYEAEIKKYTMHGLELVGL
jgi:hypothetical protein